jgi:hypothetical protein
MAKQRAYSERKVKQMTAQAKQIGKSLGRLSAEFDELQRKSDKGEINPPRL